MKLLLLVAGLSASEVSGFSPAALSPFVHPRVRSDTSRTPATSMVDAGALSQTAELWHAYLRLLESPETALPTKAVTAAILIGSGDAAAQLVDRSAGKPFDVVRVARWALFGFILQAPWNHFYYLALDGAIPPTADPFTTTTAVKVAIDQFIQAPIFTAIIFVFFALIEGKGLAFAKQQISSELGQVLVKNWVVFLPATFINLAYLPNELRVLFLNGVFFFWVIFLSLTVNADSESEELPLQED